MPCKQKCKHWNFPKRPADGKRYENGQMRCDQCEIWLDPTLELHTHDKHEQPEDDITRGLFCDCCNSRVSGRAKAAKYGKTPESTETSLQTNSSDVTLLNYLSNMNMQANYKPIVIKILIEKGFQNNYTTSSEVIKNQIELLNFDREDFSRNNVDDSVYRALDPYVLFDGNNVSLDYDFTSDDEKKQCLKICGQKIASWHIEDNIMNQENQCYFIRAGEKGEYWKEFKTNNFVAVDYLDEDNPNSAGDFDLSDLTKNEITKRKGNADDVTELFNISQIKKGDIIAVVNDLKTVEEFAIATSNYYYENLVKVNKHRVNVEYLNFGTTKIGNGAQKGIIRDAQNKIKDFLTEDNLEYFLLRHNVDGTWKDDLGKKYHFGRTVPNQIKLREAGIGTKTIWFTKQSGEFYFWGHGSVKEVETIQDNVEWNLTYDNFKYFEEYDDSIVARGKFLKKANKSIKQQIENLSRYNPQTSMFTITKKIYQQIIGEDLTPEEEKMDTMSDDNYDRALKWKPNLILYGPPGTGKTYHANEIAEKQISDNIIKSNVTKKISVEQKIAQLMLENSGIEMDIEEITNKIIETEPDRDNSELLLNIQNILNGNTMIDKENLFYKKYGDKKYGLDLPFKIKKSFRFVLFANNTPMYQAEIVNGCKKSRLLPDEWNWNNRNGDVEFDNDKNLKEESMFLHTNDKYSLRNSNYFEETLDAKNIFIKKVTFHPSYSYEDFMEGFRPNEKDMDKIPYVLDIGIFQEICNEAKNDLGNTYVLIIDEINRGNIPKILGELITLIEKDKRKPKYSLKLTYSKKDFFVPENLIIIGTMNTADKSLMQMDDALKRRFVFEEIMPDTKLLEEHLLKENKVSNADHYSKILKRINEKITGDGKNKEAMMQFRDRQIGHSYFWDIGIKNNPDNDFQSIIKYDIIPLLQDYFYGDYSKIREILSNEDDDYAIIGKDNRTTELVNDISQSLELKKYLLKI